jgi:hypothetical protein
MAPVSEKEFITNQGRLLAIQRGIGQITQVTAHVQIIL